MQGYSIYTRTANEPEDEASNLIESELEVILCTPIQRMQPLSLSLTGQVEEHRGSYYKPMGCFCSRFCILKE